MAVYARRSRTRHKPAWRAKQRGPEAEHEREYQASRAEEARRQAVDPVEPVGTPETNQPRDETGTPRK
ncbi:MAG TPA: hypothetical protein VM528_06085 [Burkholderiaceae bacterium]|jgi:hypothetical protein|nr:hypothetical protein [Burkholderiaceae bacterium]